MEEPASFSGKVKMVLQCVAVACVLAARSWPDLLPEPVTLSRLATWATWAAVASTAWSGIEYLWAARHLIR